MKIAVVGATGLVGTKMLQVLQERNFPVTELIPVASQSSVGKQIQFNGKSYSVVSMMQALSLKPQIALFSAGGSTSLESLTTLVLGAWILPFRWWFPKSTPKH
jgi:aspartate-semialdehyde dehydrogenase